MGDDWFTFFLGVCEKEQAGELSPTVRGKTFLLQNVLQDVGVRAILVFMRGSSVDFVFLGGGELDFYGNFGIFKDGCGTLEQKRRRRYLGHGIIYDSALYTVAWRRMEASYSFSMRLNRTLLAQFWPCVCWFSSNLQRG